MPINKSWYTAEKDDWATPQALFDQLNEEFHFTVDVCANQHNHKCPVYWNEDQNGLAQDWSGHMCWVNPPYSYKANWTGGFLNKGLKGEYYGHEKQGAIHFKDRRLGHPTKILRRPE